MTVCERAISVFENFRDPFSEDGRHCVLAVWMDRILLTRLHDRGPRITEAWTELATYLEIQVRFRRTVHSPRHAKILLGHGVQGSDVVQRTK